MGLRIFDLTRQRWADYWVNSTTGIMPAKPTWGGFQHGVGTWDSEEEDGAGGLIVRGVWDHITPDSCRWHQTVSRDGGTSWTDQWLMHWTRITPTV